MRTIFPSAMSRPAPAASSTTKARRHSFGLLDQFNKLNVQPQRRRARQQPSRRSAGRPSCGATKAKHGHLEMIGGE